MNNIAVFCAEMRGDGVKEDFLKPTALWRHSII